ncbi:MAG: glycerophosphoryl diester phosphodiesterase [Planctomycetota bacterium]|jgi:glycerophosphoryl diester phosphodiesterase
MEPYRKPGGQQSGSLSTFILLYCCLFAINGSSTTTANSLSPARLNAAYLVEKIEGRLPTFIECIRESEIGIISAHRGGPVTGFPENALESVIRISELAPVFVELDVMQSRDGVLFLHHDKNLERTTTGNGSATALNWDTLRRLTLVDKDGKETGFTLPSFEEVLIWSKDKALLQLDVKAPTSINDVINLVLAKNAQGRVVFILYSIDDALRVLEKIPNTLVSISVKEDAGLAKVLNLDINSSLIGLSGAEKDNSDFYHSLNELGVSVLASSYGRVDSIESMIGQQPMPKIRNRMRQAMKKGIQIIVSNQALALYQSLMGDKDYQSKLVSCANRASQVEYP